MNEILSQVGNFGFPMVVSIYLLVKIERKLDELTKAINNLGRIMAEQ